MGTSIDLYRTSIKQQNISFCLMEPRLTGGSFCQNWPIFSSSLFRAGDGNGGDDTIQEGDLGRTLLVLTSG